MTDPTCSIDGCDHPAGYRGRKLRGWCTRHYRVWAKHGDPTARPVRPRNTGKCRVCGESSAPNRLNWCEACYCRTWRNGTPGYRVRLKVLKRKRCEVCSSYFTGRLSPSGPVRHCSRACAGLSNTGDRNPTWKGDDVGYSAVHSRVRRVKGAASDYPCVDCGGNAQHWSVDRDAPRLRFEDGMPYSSEPDDYYPRCAACHKAYDMSRLATSGVGWPD